MDHHEFSHRDPRDLDGARTRKRLMSGVLMLIAAGAVVITEPALSAPPAMPPSVGAPPPKPPPPAPGAVSPGPGTPTVVAPQLPVLAPTLPMTGAPRGFPSGSNIPTPGNPISKLDIIVIQDPGGTPTKLQTDGRGSFPLGALPTGNYEIKLSGMSLEHAIGASFANDGGAKGPANIIGILIALLLPAPQLLDNAGNRGTDTAGGPVLVEHRFPRGTLGQGVHIKFRVGKNGAAMTIDWGDGTSVMDVGREGKRVGSDANTANGGSGTAQPGRHNYIGTVTLVR